MERGVHTTNLNLDKIIRGKIAQDSGFLAGSEEPKEAEDNTMKAITLLMKLIQQVDEKNSKHLKLIEEQQKEILEILKKK